jgi:hypothetical protein
MDYMNEQKDIQIRVYAVLRDGNFSNTVLAWTNAASVSIFWEVFKDTDWCLHNVFDGETKYEYRQNWSYITSQCLLSHHCFVTWCDVRCLLTDKQVNPSATCNVPCRVQLKCDGTRWRTGREVKWKLENGVDIQYSSHYLGTWCIQHYYCWYAHLGCQ